ncbi:hypothetical protein ACFL34_05915 [Candidatus Sumerlaeota bacterium]
MSVVGWVILSVVNIPLYVVVGYAFFDSWDKFFESITCWLTPDMVSAARGDYWDDRAGTFRLFLFLLTCGILVWAEGAYLVIPYVLPLFK